MKGDLMRMAHGGVNGDFKGNALGFFDGDAWKEVVGDLATWRGT